MHHLIRRGANWALRNFLNVISWDGSGDKYVGQFRKNLERIAFLVSEKTDRWVEARYNNVTECAELFCPYDRVLARVVVHGEFNPSTAYVVSPILPSEEIQGIFRDLLRRPLAGQSSEDDVEVRFRAVL